MTPERTPGLSLVSLTRLRAVGLALGCSFFLAGCGNDSRDSTSGTTDPAQTPTLTERGDRGLRLPPPDVAEIKFDENTGMLRLYEPPAPARWMVQLPHDKTAVPVDREYKLPEGIDGDRTLIYYAVPAGRQSKAVTLTEVQEAGELLTSRGQ